jgi:hypothetical protein
VCHEAAEAGQARIVKDQAAGGNVNKEHERNEHGRGGDVIVQDSVASGKPDLPIDKDFGRETNVAINADELGAGDEREPGGDQQQGNRRAEE